jgi:hypothetical protein
MRNAYAEVRYPTRYKNRIRLKPKEIAALVVEKGKCRESDE